MKKTIVFGTVLFISLNVFCTVLSSAEAFKLPEVAARELARLEEAYHVLDRVAGDVWQGWTDYKEVPFLLNFENGLRVLIGFPNPPTGFELLPGVRAAGRTVYVDKRNIVPLELKDPLTFGGGVTRLGSADGGVVEIVEMYLRKISPDIETEAEDIAVEGRILIYIHELFHFFQRGRIKIEYPNLRFNPDTDYAVYSEIEGLALEKAYLAKDNKTAGLYVRDFLVARRLKRENMSREHRDCEAADEVREGTAVYSEVRTLELLGKGFKPRLTSRVDPYYGEFRDIEPFTKKYLESLRHARADSYDSTLKRYRFGCFQALLLQRLFPGWQESFCKDVCFLDAALEKRVPIDEEVVSTARARFRDIYNYDEIHRRHKEAIDARDAAYRMLTSREGRTYVIGLKGIRQVAGRLVKKAVKSFRMGLMDIYPDGIGTVKVDEIEIASRGIPTEANQLYYFKWVDTGWKGRGKPYEFKYEKKEGGDMYFGVVLETPVFTLRAPKIRFKDSGKRVKVWILSRVSPAPSFPPKIPNSVTLDDTI